MSSIVRKSTRIKNQVLKIDSARVVALLVDFFGISPEKPSFEDRKLFERILKLMPRPKLVDPCSPEVILEEEDFENPQGPEVEVIQFPTHHKIPENSQLTTTIEPTDPPSPSYSTNSYDGGFSPGLEDLYSEDSLENIQKLADIPKKVPLECPEVENAQSVVSQRKRGRCKKDSTQPKSKRGRSRKPENFESLDDLPVNSELVNPSIELSVEVEPKHKLENLETLDKPLEDSSIPNQNEGTSLVNQSVELNNSSEDQSEPAHTESQPNSSEIPNEPQKRKINRKPRPPMDPKLRLNYRPGDSSDDDELEDRYCTNPKDQEFIPPEEPKGIPVRTIEDERLELAYRYWTKQSMDLSVPLKLADMTTRPSKKSKPTKLSWGTVSKRFPAITCKQILYRYHARLLTGNQRVTVERIAEETYKRFQEAVARGEVVRDKNIQELAMQVKAELDPEGRLTNFKASDTWTSKFKTEHGIKLKKLYPLNVIYPRVEGSRHWKKEQKAKAVQENSTTKKSTKSKHNSQIESNSIEFQQNFSTSYEAIQQVIPDNTQMTQQYVIHSTAATEPIQTLRIDQIAPSDLNRQFGVQSILCQQQQAQSSSNSHILYQEHYPNTQDLFYQLLNQDHNHQI